MQKVQFAQCFADNGGRAHGKHAACKNTVGKAPAQKLRGSKAQAGDAYKFRNGGDDGRVGGTFYFIEIIIKAKVEQNEDNADISPDADAAAVDDVREQRKVRAGKKARQHIAENERLVKLFAQNGGQPGQRQNHGQVTDKRY